MLPGSKCVLCRPRPCCTFHPKLFSVVQAPGGSNAGNYIGRTLNCDHRVAQLQVEHGADANPKNWPGEFFFPMLATGTSGLAQLLLEHGADPNILSMSGKDSLYMAPGQGHPGLTAATGAQRRHELA